MAVLGIATAAGWILYLSSPVSKGPESTTSVEHQPSQTNEQLNELKTQLGLLTTDHESLIQENLALRTLNEALNEAQEEAAAESSRADQQVLDLEQTVNSVNQSASSLQDERLQLLAQVDHLTTQLKNLSQSTNQTETVVSDTTTGESAPEQTAQTVTAETTTQIPSEETSELSANFDELNIEVLASLKESVSGLQNQLQTTHNEVDRLALQLDSSNRRAKYLEIRLRYASKHLRRHRANKRESEVKSVSSLQDERLQLLAQVDQLEKNQEETVFRFSEQLDENNAELEKALQQQQEQSEAIVQLTEQLEQVLEMSNDTMEDLQSATGSDSEVSEVADTSMETTPAEVVAESSQAGQQVLNLEQTVKNLNQSVSGLQNQLQTTHNEVDRLALQLDSSNRRAKYLEIRLRYASKHLRRHRTKMRETEVKSENLEMERQELQENLSEVSSTLHQSIAENETEIALLVSKFSMIRLESDVIFDSGSAKLSTQGLETLRDIAQKYQDYPDRIMSIEGHTDNKLIAGNLARFYPTNWELSAARAAAAANFLTQQGVPEDKLRIVGFGALQPIASNDTEEGRASNRRIEIRLAPKLSEAETN